MHQLSGKSLNSMLLVVGSIATYKHALSASVGTVVTERPVLTLGLHLTLGRVADKGVQACLMSVHWVLTVSTLLY